jgi:hypothetical protein
VTGGLVDDRDPVQGRVVGAAAVDLGAAAGQQVVDDLGVDHLPGARAGIPGG